MPILSEYTGLIDGVNIRGALECEDVECEDAECEDAECEDVECEDVGHANNA